jgi:hypothetical protein
MDHNSREQLITDANESGRDSTLDILQPGKKNNGYSSYQNDISNNDNLEGEELQGGAKLNDKDLVDKLKKQNGKLKKELKELTEALNEIMSRTQIKKQPAPTVHNVRQTFQSEESMAKQLENAGRQLAIYQRDIKLLSQKNNSEGNLENYYKLQDKVNAQELALQKAILEKRNLDKALKQKEKELDSLRKSHETQTDVNFLNEQIRVIRDKIRDMNKKDLFDQDQLQKKDEYIKNLEAKYKKAIDKSGYDPDKDPLYVKSQASLPKKSVEPELSKKPRQAWKAKSIHEEDNGPIELTEEKFLELRQNVKILKKAEKASKTTYDKDAEILKKKIETLNKESEEFTKKINEKEQEIKIFNIKVKEITKMVRHHALAPIESKDKEDTHTLKRLGEKSPEPEDARESVKGGFRRDERGTRASKKGGDFSDQDALQEEKAKILSLIVWTNEKSIAGVRAAYKTEDGQVIKGGAHVKNQSGKNIVFETAEGDYVKEISGFIDRAGGIIECLIITSFRGESLRVGQPQKGSKLFKFDINEMEYPACLYGTLKEEGNESVLAKLGVLIAVDEPIEENIHENEDARYLASNERSRIKKDNDTSVIRKSKAGEKKEDNGQILDTKEGDADEPKKINSSVDSHEIKKAIPDGTISPKMNRTFETDNDTLNESKIVGIIGEKPPGK